MFAANPIDPARTTPIVLRGPAGPSSPYPRRAPAAWPVAVAVGGALALAFAAAALTSPRAATAGHAGKAADPGAPGPVPGEFRLGPGNAQPPGIVLPLAAPADPGTPGAVPGEFRLGPGNAQPPGLIR